MWIHPIRCSVLFPEAVDLNKWFNSEMSATRNVWRVEGIRWLVLSVSSGVWAEAIQGYGSTMAFTMFINVSHANHGNNALKPQNHMISKRFKKYIHNEKIFDTNHANHGNNIWGGKKWTIALWYTAYRHPLKPCATCRWGMTVSKRPKFVRWPVGNLLETPPPAQGLGYNSSNLTMAQLWL